MQHLLASVVRKKYVKTKNAPANCNAQNNANNKKTFHAGWY